MSADSIQLPIYGLLGIEVDPREDQSIARLRYRPEIGNSRDHMHGGAIATLLDVAAGRAVRLSNRQATGVASIDMTIHYLAPVFSDLTARGKVLTSGNTVAIAEVLAHREDGTLTTRATVTFRVFMPRPGA